MRLYLSLGIGWLLSGSLLLAQVKVELQLGQGQYLPGETMPLAVRITNLSGQVLQLGKDTDWLKFAIEAVDGFIVSKNGEVPVAEEFSLESAKVATKRVDLAPYFNLTNPGRYRLTVSVKVPQWDQTITSPPVSFDVIKGVKLWDQEFGVPASPNATNARPEVRKYLLQQANYLKRLELYVRITDPSETINYRVLPVGPLISFSRPEHQLDRYCNLHLLNQTGARSYTYCVVTPNGRLIIRQTHDSTNTRPTLKANAEGNITVLGGSRRITVNDLPAPDAAKPSPASKTTAP